MRRKILKNILITTILMPIFSNLAFFNRSDTKRDEQKGLQEQALFSGFYQQGYVHQNSETPVIAPMGNSILRFNLGSRTYNYLSFNLENNDIYSSFFDEETDY